MLGTGTGTDDSDKTVEARVGTGTGESDETDEAGAGIVITRIG